MLSLTPRFCRKKRNSTFLCVCKGTSTIESGLADSAAAGCVFVCVCARACVCCVCACVSAVTLRSGKPGDPAKQFQLCHKARKIRASWHSVVTRLYFTIVKKSRSQWVWGLDPDRETNTHSQCRDHSAVLTIVRACTFLHSCFYVTVGTPVTMSTN